MLVEINILKVYKWLSIGGILIIMATELPLSRPVVKRRISALEVMQGKVVPPIERVKMMSADDYETFTLEWVFGFLATNYIRIRSFAGAGDKGRDVVGYVDDKIIDVYQCKHYDNKIAPTTLCTELGKLCYYTFNGVYPIPRKYYIVAPEGCGPEVLDLIANPQNIISKLYEHWDKHCKDKITKKEVIELTGDFKDYVDTFDFSIVTDIAPHEIIDQHSKTQYHATTFGGGIKRYREIISKPDPHIQIREEKYTTMLFEVYGQKLSKAISNTKELETNSPELLDHFNDQRNGFYSAESLEKFSRENFPEAEPLPFDELKDEAESVLKTTLAINMGSDGFTKLLHASQEIKRQSFQSNPLSMEIKNLDKDGLCHHLANEDRIKWI